MGIIESEFYTKPALNFAFVLCLAFVVLNLAEVKQRTHGKPFSYVLQKIQMAAQLILPDDKQSCRLLFPFTKTLRHKLRFNSQRRKDGFGAAAYSVILPAIKEKDLGFVFIQPVNFIISISSEIQRNNTVGTNGYKQAIL